MPGADIDPFDLTRIMSWQPCDIPPTSTPGQAPRESASLEALASLRDPAQGTADPIIVDGVVPTALIQELSRMCHIQYQGGGSRVERGSLAEGKVAAARVVAGATCDYVTII